MALFCQLIYQATLVQPIMVESLDPMHESARQFLAELGRKISVRSRDDREGTFCFSIFQFCCFISILFCCATVLFQLTIGLSA